MMQVSFSNAAQLYQQNQKLGAELQGKNKRESERQPSKTDNSPSDTFSISSTTTPNNAEKIEEKPGSTNNEASQTDNSSNPANQALDSEELQELQKLKSRDAEVRAHEQAHLASAGQYAAGGPTFTYQSGPDGKRYAVGGEVPIDISKEPTPEATITKMRAVRRAALAPANPSPADRQIASQAAATEAQAVVERQSAESEETTNTQTPPNSPEIVAENQNQPEQAVSNARRAMMISAYETYASMA